MKNIKNHMQIGPPYPTCLPMSNLSPFLGFCHLKSRARHLEVGQEAALSITSDGEVDADAWDALLQEQDLRHVLCNCKVSYSVPWFGLGLGVVLGARQELALAASNSQVML